MNLGNTALKCKITSLLGQKGFHFHHSSHLQVDRVTVTGMLIGIRNEFTSEHESRVETTPPSSVKGKFTRIYPIILHGLIVYVILEERTWCFHLYSQGKKDR